MRLDGAEHRPSIKHVMAGGYDTVQFVGCDEVGFSRTDERRSDRTRWPRPGPRFRRAHGDATSPGRPPEHATAPAPTAMA